MTTREQLTHERVNALLSQLEELQNQSEFGEIARAEELGEAQSVVSQRSRTVDEIVADYQSARSDFDGAVSNYSAASTTADELAAVAAAVQAQQAQIDEIVEYLVLTEESL
jgi:hypothetical protein